MDPLIAARAQMELSLGFHMIFAALGIGMPLLLLIAEGLHLRYGAAADGSTPYLDLAHAWGRATALLFAIGAVSGTALSFELGLLWPGLMAQAGSVLGPAFALEGYAFFIEAIFIGLYLYGWGRLSPRAHWLSAVPVALSGLLSGVLVVAANAWMQRPVDFAHDGARLIERVPGAVLRAPLWPPMAVHASLACYAATGFAAAGVYAAALLRRPGGARAAYCRAGLRIALTVGAVAALCQVLSGDRCAKAVARFQPIKLAAMEAHFRTGRHVPLLVGGLPDVPAGEVRWALRIPSGLSWMAFGRADAEVAGLDKVRPELRPNVVLCHVAFQIMVACGGALALLSVVYGLSRLRRPPRDEGRWLLRAALLCSPLGFVALEAGWVVTEAGRQPWTVYGVLATRDAVTPVPGAQVAFSLAVFTILYAGLGVALVVLLRRLGRGGEA